MRIAAAMPQLWLFAFKAFHRSWNVRPVRNFRDHLVQFPFLLKWEMKSKEVDSRTGSLVSGRVNPITGIHFIV